MGRIPDTYATPDPTPDEIEDECAYIRSTWSDEERERRDDERERRQHVELIFVDRNKMKW